MIKDSYVPTLLNKDSEGQTPASLAIDIHYLNLRLVERWTWERYLRLCVYLKLTEYELASLVRLPHKVIGKYRAGFSLPLPRGSAESVALLLTLVETHFMQGLRGDVITEIFPKVNR